jgi:hypothetical protein
VVALQFGVSLAAGVMTLAAGASDTEKAIGVHLGGSGGTWEAAGSRKQLASASRLVTASKQIASSS